MKIIITGATGAFGASIVKYLSKVGHEIIAIGRWKEPPNELLKYATYIQHDITNQFSLPDADVCIHAAAMSDDKATPEELYSPNVIGTKNTIEAAKNCQTFVFISSSSVYLPQAAPITEDQAGKQNNKLLSPYGNSKLLAEEMVLKECKNQSRFILRPRAFYGPGDNQIAPRMMKLVKNHIFNKPGELTIQLSMTHYENMGKAIECCLESNLKGTHIYNVADTEVYTMISTLRKLFETIYGEPLKEKKIPIQFLKVLAFLRVGGFTPLLVRALTQNMVLNTSKIERELHFTSKLRFDESLPELKFWIQRIGGPEKLKTGDKNLPWQN